MTYPMQCIRCGNIHDGATVTVVQRYSDCSVWRCPGCGVLIDDRPRAWGGSAERVHDDFRPTEGSVAVSTTTAPMVAHNTEREGMARAAAKAGMTLADWIEYTDRLEAREKSRRGVEQMMRQVPRYRDEGAA